MKVCLATLRHEFRNSGEIESLVNLRDYLSKKEVHSDILTPEGTYSSAMPESKSGLSLSKAGDLGRLYRVLESCHPGYDIIHLFLPFPSFSFYGDFIKYKIKKKLVTTFESCIVRAEGAGKINFFLHEPFNNILRLLINNDLLGSFSLYSADAYIVSSHYQKKGLPSNKTYVIPNLTNTEKFRKTERTAARSNFGFPDDAVVISYVGHLLEIKGVSDLLFAFCELSRRSHNLRLAMAFSGIGYLDKIKRLAEKLGISEKVFFYGSVCVSEFMSACDILVLPYRYSFGTNWFPSVLLEGLSVGIPILTSDLASLHELNEICEVLFFAKAGDPEDLASRINMLLNDTKKLERTVRNQRQLMYTKFNPNLVIEKYTRVYETILREKN